MIKSFCTAHIGTRIVFVVTASGYPGATIGVIAGTPTRVEDDGVEIMHDDGTVGPLLFSYVVSIKPDKHRGRLREVSGV